MARVLIDLYKAKDLYSGLGQFSVNFTEALIAHPRTDQDITFLTPRKFTWPSLKGQNAEEVNTLKRYFPQFNKKYDVWHSLHQFPSHFPRSGSKFILTVHDLNFMLEKSAAKAEKYRTTLQRNLDRADAVTAISHFTKGMLEQHNELRGKVVRVIHNGVRMDQYPTASKPSFTDHRKFFLAIGVFKEKKNLHTLLPLMKHFPDHQLVMAGNHNTPYGADVKRSIVALGLEHQVQLPGAVDDGTKYWLYKHCEALLFPSLAEGFGMPVIEALGLGTPVFATRHTSVPEVGGDAAYYFDGTDPVHMAAVISEKLAEHKSSGQVAIARAQGQAAKFIWSDRIKEYQNLYAELL